MDNDDPASMRPVNEPRVYRRFALPVSAFDVLKSLQRRWRMRTNAEVVTRLLLAAGICELKLMEKNDDDA